MRHAHTISGDDLSLSDRQHREHLALIECREELVRLNREVAALRVTNEQLAALVARVRRIVS